MSYLRGAVMKIGQTVANFPDIVPHSFVDTLEHLHSEAPPMHWSLLREMVHNELGDDPDKLFASFEQRAFAAASLGQVHRARLKSGEEVAVKIQYPGIGRTICEDFRNFFLLLLPGRLGKDWENTKDQFNDLRVRLERETDYEAEAATLTRVRPLFRDADGIVVPRVYPQHSTARVLTMDRLDGVHLDEYLARNPSQEDRNEFARKLIRGSHVIRGPPDVRRSSSRQFRVHGRRPARPDRLRLRARASGRRVGAAAQDGPRPDDRETRRSHRQHQGLVVPYR
jgi:predicted unusual protein kinase regulating ubiquinone biosynthesis (AarF/ABC1/UbiB family)